MHDVRVNFVRSNDAQKQLARKKKTKKIPFCFSLLRVIYLRGADLVKVGL